MIRWGGLRPRCALVTALPRTPQVTNSLKERSEETSETIRQYIGPGRRAARQQPALEQFDANTQTAKQRNCQIPALPKQDRQEESERHEHQYICGEFQRLIVDEFRYFKAMQSFKESPEGWRERFINVSGPEHHSEHQHPVER